MKKNILVAVINLSLFFTNQIMAQQSNESLKQKESNIGNKKNPVVTTVNSEDDDKRIKPIVYTGSKQYDLLKTEGRLAHYEIRQEEGKIVSIEKTIYSPSGKATTSTLTPCDIVPPGTTAPFAGPVDDQTSALINLPFNFCFYGTNYTQVRMSSNGNIQFPPTNNSAFSSTGFPVAADKMIAPFWADVDNRGTGTYGYTIFSTYAVFSWINVGYYNSHTNLTNDFQMVITDGLDPILPPGKNVGFYYGNMQWTTGDASSGLNGFPNPTVNPAVPATVGANAGNGVDYFLIGRFGQAGSAYDGPLGANDGVSWLNGKRFYFNVCPPTGANNEPIPTLIGYCDTLKVCGNDTLIVKNTFIAPEVSQSVTVTVTAPSLGASFSYSVLPNTNSTDVYMIVDGSTAPGGYHTVTMNATDNGTPALTSSQNFVIFVNQGAINNLDGTLIITPTVGACPGQTVSASVSLSGGTPDSYLWSNNSTGTSTTFTTVVPADSLIFVTITSGQCRKTLVGDININPTPVADISGNLNYCNGNSSTTVLTATNTLNPSSQGPHTYSWAGTGTLSSNNTATTAVNAGVYTVTVTNQFGCSSVKTTTVVMNDSPKYTLNSMNAISGGSVYCVNQDTARIGINFGQSSGQACGLGMGLCASPNIVSIGTASGANSNTGSPSVYGNYFKNIRCQMLYTAAELLAAGAIPGKLSSISFQVNSMMPLNTTGTSSSSTYIGTLPNYSIKLKCTTSTVLTSTFDGTGLTQVFMGNVTPTVGLNTQTFSQPYIWDGTSNLLVDVCYTRTTSLSSTYYTSNPVMPYTNVGSAKCVYFNSDATLACGNLTGTTTNNRPDIKFGNCSANQMGSQFNIVVTPTTGVIIPASHDSIRIDLPNSPGLTCYTVSIINPIGNCTKDTVICVEALQGITQGTLASSNYSVCPGQPVTLNAQGTLTSYTIQYIDDIGTQTSTVSPVTFNAPNTPGAYTYTMMATGPCGGPLTAFTNTLNVLQGVTVANLTFSQDSVCPGTPVTLAANGSILPTYTITYGTSSGTTSVVGNSVTITPTLSVSGFQTYTLTAEGPCGGPVTSFVDSLKIYQGITQATVTASADTLCPGSPITLNYSGVLTTFTLTYSDASGVHTTTTVPLTYTPMAVSNPSFGYVTYTLTGEGPCSAPIKSFKDSVYIKQGITQGMLAVSNSTLCAGSNVTLSALGSLASYTIAYVDANGATQTSVNNPVTFVPTSTTSPAFGIHTYSLIAEGPCSGPVTVFTNTLNVVQGVTQATLAVSDNTLCAGSSVTLSALGSLASYTIAYVDANGTPQTSVNNPVTFVPTSTTSPAFGMHTYSLIAQGPCSGPVTVFTNTLNVVQGVTQATLAVSNNTLCAGSNVTLSALGTLATYTIAYVDANGATQTSVNNPVTFVPASLASPVFGIHTYSLIAQGPCSGPVTVFTNTIDVVQGVTQATLATSQSVLCIGSPVTLSSTGSLFTYTITYNNGSLASSVNNPVTFNTAIGGINIYTLTAQGFCSAPVVNYTASVLVNNLLTLSITPMADVTKCLNSSVTLSANVAASAAQPYTYMWLPASGTNTNSTYVTSTPVTTTFVVIVNGSCANTATASVVVRNFATDINVFITDSASVCANTELVLNSVTTGGKAPYSYSWTILPDVNSLSSAPTLNTTSPGTEGAYIVRVVSTDSCGFTDSDDQLIVVLPPCGIEIGNIITPNGDGVNDFFKIKNIEYHPNSSLIIFDRWGKKVFSSANYANEWKAEGLHDGTFFYILDVPDDKKYNGFVQVLR